LLVSLTISPVKNREGKIVDASKILRDITERSAKGAKGIAREMLARIWDLFVQAELQSYRSRRIGDRADGVQNLVWLHGGSVEVRVFYDGPAALT
jgi:hypothetical protein